MLGLFGGHKSSISNGSGWELLIYMGPERINIQEIKKRGGLRQHGFVVVNNAEIREFPYSGGNQFVSILLEGRDIICENVVQASGTAFIVTRQLAYKQCHPGRTWQDCDGYYWSRSCLKCNVMNAKCRCPSN